MKYVNRVLIVIIFAATSAVAEMDWENFTLKTTGTTQASSRESLQKELNALQYDENSTVGDFLRLHFDRANKMSGLLFQYQSTKQDYLTDGSIEYTHQLPITNKIMSLLLPDTKPVKLVVPMLCPTCGQEWPANKPVPQGQALIPKQIESIEFTGIIIDCRGLNLVPCLFPKVYTNLMEEVYSVSFAELSSVVNNGLVLYTTQDLYNHPRIGYNPLRIKAIGVSGKNPTDIKISQLDARRIHGLQKNIELLKECRVAIIVGY